MWFVVAWIEPVTSRVKAKRFNDDHCEMARTQASKPISLSKYRQLRLAFQLMTLPREGVRSIVISMPLLVGAHWWFCPIK